MAKFSLINSNGIQWLISKIKGHTENKNNPHGVTKAQVGLSKVSNLDQSKAISKVTTGEQGFTGTALDGSTTTWDMPKVIKDCSMESSPTSFRLLYTYTDTSEKTVFIKNGDGIYPGITKVYSNTGSNTDGAISQKAATNAINNVNNKIIYTNDGSNNITFPKQVTATQFNGSLNGNAKTATTATSANTANSAKVANVATTANEVSNSLKIKAADGISMGSAFDGSAEVTITLPVTNNPILYKTNVTLDLTKATADSTYEGYPYKVTATMPTCTPEHYPQVILKNSSDGVYINSICSTSYGTVTFYVTKNTGSIILDTILLIRGIEATGKSV